MSNWSVHILINSGMCRVKYLLVFRTQETLKTWN